MTTKCGDFTFFYTKLGPLAPKLGLLTLKLNLGDLFQTPPKIKGVDLGKKTGIQGIISRADFGESSRATARVRSHMRSRGQSVSQPESPLIVEV